MAGLNDYYDLFVRNWQNPGAIPIPEEFRVPPRPNIPPGDMMPPTGKPNALRVLNPRNPLAFKVPAVDVPTGIGIPPVEIPNYSTEMMRSAGQQPRMLRYSGSDVGAMADRPAAPPRPLSGLPPRVPTPSGLPVPQQSVVFTQNASALTPAQQGGAVRPPFSSVQPPYIEGEFSRVDARPVSVNSQTAAGGGQSGKGGGSVPSSRGTMLPGMPLKPLSFAVRALAGSAVPAMSASIASSINATEYPKISDQDMLYLAEVDPVFYAANRSYIDDIINRKKENTKEHQSSFDWNRGIGIQLWEKTPESVKSRIKSALTGKGFLGPEIKYIKDELTKSKTAFSNNTDILNQTRNYPVGETVSPEEAMKLLSSTNGSRSTAPTPALPPMSDAARMEAQKGVPITTDSAAIREAARIDAERKGLLAQGYTPANNQPGATDPRYGAPYLGLNDILVKERLANPQEYTQAVNANQLAAQRGRQMGLPQDPNTQPYTPNDATLAGMKYGGPVTEYAIPGKGTATFLGERQGGGTLSVVSGRTPEEQKAIDAQVKSIDAQTAAMRSIRNANRQAQGLPTVEQEDQMNAMAAMMGRMAPSTSNTSGLDERQAQLMQELQDASNIHGFGKRQLREDKMKAAQTGLALVEAQRKAMDDQATRQQAAGLAMIQNMTAQDAARAKAAQDQAQALREQFNTDREFNLKNTQAEIDAYAKSRNISLEQAKYELEAFKTTNPTQSNVRFPNLTGDFYGDPLKPGQPRIFDYKGAASRYGIQPVSPDGKGMVPGEPYYLEDGRVITVDAQGTPIPFNGGWEGAAYQKWLGMQKR